MGDRRMFSKRITDSASFLKMPVSTRELYFQLGMHADDDGIVEAFKVMRMIGATEDDLKVLTAKSMVRVLNEDLITYITDWREHNIIRSDRKVDSIYKGLLLQILPETPLLDAKPRADTGSIPTGKSGRPVDVQRTSQVKLSKVKLSEDNIIKIHFESDYFSVTEETHSKYREAYPNIDIDAQYRKMVAWLDSNPSKRKTERGYPRFINSWLSRAGTPAPDKQYNTATNVKDDEYFKRTFLNAENAIFLHESGVKKLTPEALEKSKNLLSFTKEQLSKKGIDPHAN